MEVETNCEHLIVKITEPFVNYGDSFRLRLQCKYCNCYKDFEIKPNWIDNSARVLSVVKNF